MIFTVSYINISENTENFALSFLHDLEADHEGVYPSLAWWFVDGVLNLEPHGIFRVEKGYLGETDHRTIGSYLDQEPKLIWAGIQTLRDLFNSQVLLLMKEKFIAYYISKGNSSISEDEWEIYFQPDWEKTLYLFNLNPSEPESIWEGFLSLRAHPVIEKFKLVAEAEAKSRKFKIAQLVTQVELEETVVRRSIKDYEGLLLEFGSESPLDLLKRLEKAYGDAGFYEMTLFAHSSYMANRTTPKLLSVILKEYPLGQEMLLTLT